MGELKADWRLRLRQGGADGPVCGAGVLLTQDRALTCAHVVTDPDARIWVEFAENPAIASVGARVAEGGWLPTVGARGEDIAVLALESPRPHATPATLERRLERGDEVWIGGYARSFADGMWLTGRISGAHGAWIQLDADRNEQVVRRGFSGAAVQVRRGPAGSPERVVGMVVSWRGDLELALLGRQRPGVLVHDPDRQDRRTHPAGRRVERAGRLGPRAGPAAAAMVRRERGTRRPLQRRPARRRPRPHPRPPPAPRPSRLPGRPHHPRGIRRRADHQAAHPATRPAPTATGCSRAAPRPTGRRTGSPGAWGPGPCARTGPDPTGPA